jgi:serine/threonine protein kinase
MGSSVFWMKPGWSPSSQEHPGIISVTNYFPANGTAYFVMEYLEGSTLKEYLAQHGGRLSFNRALALITPVMDALRELHRANVLHRDISPDNIYITESGQIKLLDFGAARQALSDRSQRLSVILKVGYAPEEQYRSAGKQGPWTDVYAVGATFYHLITGQLPTAVDRPACRGSDSASERARSRNSTRRRGCADDGAGGQDLATLRDDSGFSSRDRTAGGGHHPAASKQGYRLDPDSAAAVGEENRAQSVDGACGRGYRTRCALPAGIYAVPA